MKKLFLFLSLFCTANQPIFAMQTPSSSSFSLIKAGLAGVGLLAGSGIALMTGKQLWKARHDKSRIENIKFFAHTEADRIPKKRIELIKDNVSSLSCFTAGKNDEQAIHPDVDDIVSNDNHAIALELVNKISPHAKLTEPKTVEVASEKPTSSELSRHRAKRFVYNIQRIEQRLQKPQRRNFLIAGATLTAAGFGLAAYSLKYLLRKN